MPILSRKDLERISRRVLFRYLTLSDRKMDRIDPVDFAEKICGLHFAFADMSVTGSILGLTSYSDVDLTISVPRGNRVSPGISLERQYRLCGSKPRKCGIGGTVEFHSGT